MLKILLTIQPDQELSKHHNFFQTIVESKEKLCIVIVDSDIEESIILNEWLTGWSCQLKGIHGYTMLLE